MRFEFHPSIHRFLRNFAANGFGQVVTVVGQIFSIPLFLHYWTKHQYGEWLVLTSIPTLLWVMDAGLSVLAANRMTIATGAGNWDLANTVFQNVMLVQTALTGILLIATMILAQTVNIAALFGFTEIKPPEAGAVLVIMMGYMATGFFIGMLRAAYRASMLEARGVTYFNLWRLSDFMIVLLILPLGGGTVAMAYGMLGSVAFWALAGYFDVRRRCPKVQFAFGKISMAQGRTMVVDGIPMLAAQGASALYLQGYPLVVNHLLGPGAVVTLMAIRTGSRVLLQLVQMVSLSSSAELSRAYGRQDWTTYLRLLKIIAAAALWGSLFLGVGLAVGGPWVIQVWTSGKVQVDHEVMGLFALSVSIQAMWGVCAIALVSINRFHSLSYAYFGATLVGLAGTHLFVHFLGFNGVPVMMMTVDFSLLLWALYLCKTKLVFVPLGELRCIFTPSFYARKIRHAIKRILGTRAAQPQD